MPMRSAAAPLVVHPLGERLLDLPPPSLFGPHQVRQCRRRHRRHAQPWRRRCIDEAAIGRGVSSDRPWPGRFQSLTKGPMAEKARARGC